MCISDYQIGRMIRRRVTAWNTTGPVNTSFGRDPSRVGLIIGPSAVAIGVTSATVITFGDGTIILRPGGSIMPVILLLKDVGDLVQQDFVITAITTQHTGTTAELILPPDILTAEIAKFRGGY